MYKAKKKVKTKNIKPKEENMSQCCKTGEKPGSGTYECTNCKTHVTLGESDKMPPCPKCTNTEFKEI